MEKSGTQHFIINTTNKYSTKHKITIIGINMAYSLLITNGAHDFPP